MSNKRGNPPEIPASLPSGKGAIGSAPVNVNAPSDAWADMLAEQTLLTLWRGVSSDEQRARQLNAIFDALEKMNPRDELEGMMASQMIAAYNAIMECFRRAMIPEQNLLSREANLNLATKMMRSYSALLDAYNKHRGKNQQKVLVEHVHVHAGGQAVVGMVAPKGSDTKSF